MKNHSGLERGVIDTRSERRVMEDAVPERRVMKDAVPERGVMEDEVPERKATGRPTHNYGQRTLKTNQARQ